MRTKGESNLGPGGLTYDTVYQGFMRCKGGAL